MTLRTNPVLLLLLLLALLPSPVTAQNRREVKIQADRVDYDETRQQVRLVGHVRFETADLVMTAPFALYRTDLQVAEFQGGVKITQPGSTLVGNKMKVWYGEQRGVLTGSVRLVTEKAPGGEPRTPAVMSCQELEYRWAEGVGEARGAVKVRQGDRRAFSDRARYDRAADTVEMTGQVRFEQGKDDWVTSDSALVNLASRTTEARGQVVGRFVVEEEGHGPAAAPPSPLPAPEAVEPPLPLRPVEAAPPAGLPGLDD